MIFEKNLIHFISTNCSRKIKIRIRCLYRWLFFKQWFFLLFSIFFYLFFVPGAIFCYFFLTSFFFFSTTKQLRNKHMNVLINLCLRIVISSCWFQHFENTNARVCLPLDFFLFSFWLLQKIWTLFIFVCMCKWCVCLDCFGFLISIVVLKKIETKIKWNWLKIWEKRKWK